MPVRVAKNILIIVRLHNGLIPRESLGDIFATQVNKVTNTTRASNKLIFLLDGNLSCQLIC